MKLKIKDIEIQNKKYITILGVILNTKNTWTQKESIPKINILKSMTHTSWGAHSKPLLQVYKALILSKMEYECLLLNDAKHNNLQMIDTIHNAGLRVSLGAVKSSPCSSIYNHFFQSVDYKMLSQPHPKEQLTN